MHKLKKSTKILFIVCIVGFLLLIYPTVSNYWNRKHATHAITSYMDSLSRLNRSQYEQVWHTAVEYNKDLLTRQTPYALDNDMKARYAANLNLDGTGIMGYVEIPKIDVTLPIYHGTSNDVLQSAVGHIEWSSLPVGGESTHCVMSGHRGLPSAKLFTDLDKLREEDLFTLNILDETLTYEVDQIRTVLPDDVTELGITQGQDYCTLVTCTPYGINTHRLLVRGHRVENVIAEVHVISEAVIVDPLIVAPVLATPLLLILILMVLFKKPVKKPSREDIIGMHTEDKK